MKFTQESDVWFAREVEEEAYTVIEDAWDPKFHRDLTNAAIRIEKIAEDQDYAATNGGRTLPIGNLQLSISAQLVKEFNPKLRKLCCLN